MAQIGGARPVGSERRLDPPDQLARMVRGALGEPLPRTVPRVPHRTGMKRPVGGHVGVRYTERLREYAGFGGTVHLYQRPRPALRERDAGDILRTRAEPPDPVVPFERAPSRRLAHVTSLSMKSGEFPSPPGRKSSLPDSRSRYSRARASHEWEQRRSVRFPSFPQRSQPRRRGHGNCERFFGIMLIIPYNLLIYQC